MSLRNKIVALMLFITLVPLLFVAGLAIYNKSLLSALNKEISNYEGDGELRVTGRNFINIGYRLDLGSFDLNSASETEYVIDALPHIDKYPFLVLNTDDKVPSNILKDSIIEIALKNEKSQLLFSDVSRLAQWRFASGLSNHPDHNWKINDLLEEHLSSTKTYTLLLKYIPADIENTTKGEVSIEILAGGFY